MSQAMANCITVNNLEMQFPGCDALRDVTLNVPTGSVFALLGENGAGKTTLIQILMGFLKPTRGSCTVCQCDPAREALEIRRRVGYVSDAPALYSWMQVEEIGWFAAAFYDDAFLERYRELTSRYDLPVARKIKQLSKGQRAKVALALALAHDPELLILDEPTSGLDPLVRRAFLESMVERAASGKTVLLSSHQISEIERVADRIAILRTGRIQLVDALAPLKEDLNEITVTLADPLIAVPVPSAPTEVLHEQQEGRQCRWLIRNFTAEQKDELANHPGVSRIDSRPATLEDLFVACSKPSTKTDEELHPTTIT